MPGFPKFVLQKLKSQQEMTGIICVKNKTKYCKTCNPLGEFCFFSIAFLYSAVLCSRADSLRLHLIVHGWLAFYSSFLNIHQSGLLTALAWLLPHKTAAILMQVLCTPYNQIHVHSWLKMGWYRPTYRLDNRKHAQHTNGTIENIPNIQMGQYKTCSTYKWDNLKQDQHTNGTI